jgi:hypothetical protein
VNTYDVLSRYPTGAVLRIACLVLLGLVVRLVALPLAVAALLTGRAVTALDARVASRPAPPRSTPPRSTPPRWAAANTRTRHTATV